MHNIWRLQKWHPPSTKHTHTHAHKHAWSILIGFHEHTFHSFSHFDPIKWNWNNNDWPTNENILCIIIIQFAMNFHERKNTVKVWRVWAREREKPTCNHCYAQKTMHWPHPFLHILYFPPNFSIEHDSIHAELPNNLGVRIQTHSGFSWFQRYALNIKMRFSPFRCKTGSKNIMLNLPFWTNLSNFL